MNRTDRGLLGALAVYVLALLATPLFVDAAMVREVFSEEGPFERGAIAGWIVAAPLLLWRAGGSARAWAFAMLFLAFAARESDWNRRFTADSILKTNYYRHADAPWAQKAIAAAVVLLVAVVLVLCVWWVARHLVSGGWRRRAGAWLLGAGTLLVLTKVIDRLPNVLAHDWGLAVPPMARLMASTFEEGVELVLPLLVLRGLWLAAAEGATLLGARR